MTAFENNAERVECYACGGSGMDHDRGLCAAEKIHTCTRCQGEGTVLVDKPCSECGGNPSVKVLVYQNEEHKLSCCRCSGTGVEPRDKRMERLMVEAVENYAGDYPPFTHGGACRIEGLPLHIGCTGRDPAGFAGWCVANWQMRKDGQG